MSKVKSRKKTKKSSSPKMPFSFKRSLLPPIVGLLVMAGVFIALNAQWLVAEFTYHYRKPVAASLVASAKETNGPIISATEHTLILPSIGVKAPIIFEPSTAEWKVQLALRNGVDHFGNTATPGQKGNVVIFGHSSGQLWGPGSYKFVFTHLDGLKPNDQVIIDYQGTRYIYKVISKEIILPTNLSVLNQHSAAPMLSLITCTPVGTSRYRLIVHAQQISPDPLSANQTASATSNRLPAQLPH